MHELKLTLQVLIWFLDKYARPSPFSHQHVDHQPFIIKVSDVFSHAVNGGRFSPATVAHENL